MKRYLYIGILLALAMFVMANSTKSEEDKICSENTDYVYWPMVIDTTKLRLKNINDYYNKVDTINTQITRLKMYLNTHEWKLYYQIYIKYKELQIISKNLHPKRVKYYHAKQKLYLQMADDLRKFKQFDRIIEDRYKIEN